MAIRKKKNHLIRNTAIVGGLGACVGLIEGAGVSFDPMIKYGSLLLPPAAIMVTSAFGAFLEKYGARKIKSIRECDRTEEFLKATQRGRSVVETDLRSASSSSVLRTAWRTAYTSVAATGIGYTVGYLAANNW